MKVTPAHYVMPLLPISVGALLIDLGLFADWGLVWAAGGGFFLAVGFGAYVFTFAWVLPGKPGALLRHPLVSILVVLTVLFMLGLTVFLGIFRLS